jgi:hypothetical protein
MNHLLIFQNLSSPIVSVLAIQEAHRMSRQQQQPEDVKTLIRALVKLKAAARRERDRDSVAAAAVLEEAVAAAEKRSQARESCVGL